MHFMDGFSGPSLHLNRSPEHHSLRKKESIEGPSSKGRVLGMMGVLIRDCTAERMRVHNTKMAKELKSNPHLIKDALSNTKEKRDPAFDPHQPTVLLPRDQERNRPRWTPKSPKLSGAAAVSGEESDSPEQVDTLIHGSRPRGFVPGQVYWIREGTCRPYRLALALPYENLRQIGLPDNDVSHWVQALSDKYTFDDHTGYYVENRGSGQSEKSTWVYPMLYIDALAVPNQGDVTFCNLSNTRQFERERIDEKDVAYERLIQYLDRDMLWFVSGTDVGPAGKDPSLCL